MGVKHEGDAEAPRPRQDPSRPKVLRRDSDDRRYSDEHPWFALDHAAIIYPSILSDRVSAYYRIQAILDEKVDISLLQRALDALRPRFPYFQIELRRGFFWFFFERNDEPNLVVEDSKFPMQRLSSGRKGVYLYRVRAHADRVSLEMCHILTDGYGAMIYFRSLLAEYYRLKGVRTEYGPLVFDPSDTPGPGEWEDAFSRYATLGAPGPAKIGPAWHLPGIGLPVHTMRVVTGELSLSAALAKAKEHGATLTVYLSSVFLAALQDVQDAESGNAPRSRRLPLRLQVPANLRNFFPSSTLRNFSLFALPELDTRLGHYEFPEIVARVKATMALAFTPKEIMRTITRNVATAKHSVVRAVPLTMKNLIMRGLYRSHGEALYSSLSTNVGQARLPDSFAARVRRIDVVLPSTPGLKTVGGMLSHGDALSISFGSVIERRDLERAFFTRLVRDGLKVRVESNIGSADGKDA